MTQPRTMTVEREVQIFGYTYLTKHNMWEVENELKAERAAFAQLQAEVAGNENWWDQNSVQCQNCSVELVVRGGSIPKNHNGLSREEGEEEALCGYCAGEEVHRLTDERDELRSQLDRALSELAKLKKDKK